MTDSTKNVVRDVIAVLKAATPVTALVGQRIYTDIPAGVTMPFIRVSIISAPSNTKTTKGMDHTVQVSSFDQKDTLESVANIREKVYAAIDRNEAAFVNSTPFMVEMTGTNPIIKDPDGQTWQAVAQFRVLT